MKHNFLSERASVRFLCAVMRDFRPDTQSPRKPYGPSSSGRWCVFRLTCISLNLDIPLILHIGHFPPVLPFLFLSSPVPSCSGLCPLSLCSKLHPCPKPFSGSTFPHSLSRHLCLMRQLVLSPTVVPQALSFGQLQPNRNVVQIIIFPGVFPHFSSPTTSPSLLSAFLNPPCPSGAAQPAAHTGSTRVHPSDLCLLSASIIHMLQLQCFFLCIIGLYGL